MCVISTSIGHWDTTNVGEVICLAISF